MDNKNNIRAAIAQGITKNPLAAAVLLQRVDLLLGGPSVKRYICDLFPQLLASPGNLEIAERTLDTLSEHIDDDNEVAGFAADIVRAAMAAGRLQYALQVIEKFDGQYNDMASERMNNTETLTLQICEAAIATKKTGFAYEVWQKHSFRWGRDDEEIELFECIHEQALALGYAALARTMVLECPGMIGCIEDLKNEKSEGDTDDDETSLEE